MFFFFLVNIIVDYCFYQSYFFEKTVTLLFIFGVLLIALSEAIRKINNNKEKVFSLLRTLKKEKIFLKERGGELLVLKQYTEDQQWSKDVLFIHVGLNTISVKALLGENKNGFKMKEIESPSEKKFLWYINKYTEE
jgi:hypothetical protein